MDTLSDIPSKKKLISVGENVMPTKKSLLSTGEKIAYSSDPLHYIERNKIDLDKIYVGLYFIALHAELTGKDKYGEVLEMGPDNRSRLMASTILLELAKHIKDKNVVIAQGIFNDPKLVEQADKDAQRILAMRNKK